MSQESVIDTSRPSPGRIYDYVLGGSHNFEVDRQAAEGLLKIVPFMREAMLLQRWCLQDLATELTEKRGFDVIIDFASGLPTNDHIHHVVPKGTIVIYSDYDPVIVEYAKEILADTPDVYFFQADARRPEALLNSPAVQNILGERRDVALVLWGVSLFLSDEDIAHATQYLHRWSGPKSCLAFNAQNANTTADDSGDRQAIKIYKQMGSAIYFRTLEQYLQLLQPVARTERASFLSWTGINSTGF
jgi:hypothetical protein